MNRGLIFMATLLAFSFTPFQKEVPENRDGTAKYEEQKYDESSEEFKKGAERREGSPELSYNLGAALLKKGDADGARKAWEGALAQDPSPELRSRIYDGLGALAAGKQQYQEAENFFKRSLQNSPDRDTAANLEIVRRLLKLQQEQQEKDKRDQKDQKDEKQEEQKQDQKKDQQQDQKQDQQQQQQQQQQKPEEKKEEQQQAAQAEKKEQEEKDKKDEKQMLAPFRQRKNLQITPFMLEREGDPQGGQTW